MTLRENFQVTILKWSAGFAFQDFTVSLVNIDKLNKGKDVTSFLDSVEPGLFERYTDSGLIQPMKPTEDGSIHQRQVLIWDSRDNRPNPMKGLWTEMGVEIAPKFLGNDWGFQVFIYHTSSVFYVD